MMKTAEELARIGRQLNQERRLIEEEKQPRKVRDLLLKLGPWLGCEKKQVWRAYDLAVKSDNDVLTALRTDGEVGHLIPEGLVLDKLRYKGGLTYARMLARDIRKQGWWKQFMGYVQDYGEAIWVLPMRGAGHWVIHNTVVSASRRKTAITIPAVTDGYTDIQLIRLESFLEEKVNDD